MRTLARVVLVAVSSVVLAGATRAPQEALPPVAFEGADTRGSAVKVPAADRPTVMAFVRAGQDQSEEVLKQIAAAAGMSPGPQVVVIISGVQPAERVKLPGPSEQRTWPVVLDREFEASGRMGVHVWPTTLVVQSDGTQLAHLAGLPGLFAVQLEAYLAHASGKLDEPGLRARLEERAVVADGSEQKAGRHLKLAEKLLEQGRAESAAGELDAVMKLNPQDPQMRVSLARALVVAGRPSEGLSLLDGVVADRIPARQRSLVRGRALVGLGKWAEAGSALAEAVRMNPDPAEAHYLLGVVHQRSGDLARAAAAFRAAFEASEGGRGKVIEIR